MKVQFIYSFSDMQQITTEYEKIFHPFMKDKVTFMAYAVSQLDENEQSDLVKISSCIAIEDTDNPNPPVWYSMCKGKLWVDDLEYFKNSCQIKSTVPREFYDEFVKTNYATN